MDDLPLPPITDPPVPAPKPAPEPKAPKPQKWQPPELPDAAPDEAFALEQRVKECIVQIRASWANLAEQAYEFHGRRAHKALGYDSIEEWLASPDVEMSRRQFFYLVDTWRTLAIQHGMPLTSIGRVSISKVQDVIGAVRRGEVSAERALADCELLTRHDLRMEYRPLINKMDARDGYGEEDLRWGRCEACGSRIKLLRK